MNLEVLGIENAKDLERERVVFKVKIDLDIGRYAVLKAREKGGKVFSGAAGAYWFPDKNVKAGDWVILYTKVGMQSEKVTESGVTSHFFYWGKAASCWGTGNAAPVVLEVATWRTVRPRAVATSSQ